MLLYKCFRFSGVMDLTVRGAVQDSFRASVFTTRMGSLEMPPPPLRFYFFGVNLDYLDFSGGIFDL